nr:hypothetical protein [Massilia sp. Dwa41.01b]
MPLAGACCGPARHLAAGADDVAVGIGAAQRAQVVQAAVVEEGARHLARRLRPAGHLAATVHRERTRAAAPEGAQVDVFLAVVEEGARVAGGIPRRAGDPAAVGDATAADVAIDDAGQAERREIIERSMADGSRRRRCWIAIAATATAAAAQQVSAAAAVHRPRREIFTE